MIRKRARRITAEDRAKRHADVLALHSQGLPSITIARTLGLDQEAVVRVLTQHGYAAIIAARPSAAVTPRTGVGPNPLSTMHPIMVQIYREAGLPT